MAMTTEQLESRLLAIEQAITDLQTAVQNLASIQQLRQLYALRQQEIEEIKSSLDDIESQLGILQTSA